MNGKFQDIYAASIFLYTYHHLCTKHNEYFHGLIFIQLGCRKELCFCQSTLSNCENRKYIIIFVWYSLLIFVSLFKNSDEMRLLETYVGISLISEFCAAK